MFINKCRNTSIRRKNTKLNLFLFKKVHFRYFCFSSKTKIGKNVLGRRSIRTKKKCNFNIHWSCFFKPIPSSSLNIVLYVFFSLKLFKFISIIRNSDGIVIAKLTTTNHNLFNYYYFKDFNLKKKKNIFSYSRYILPIVRKLNYETYTFLLKKKTQINCVELFFNSGYQYARATGSNARLISVNKENKTLQIMLPSKEIKLFDLYSTSNNYKQLLLDKRKLMFDNKRYKRFSGHGPTVRGVAMNAIDHPHGGKTKSIKYPKTPWGLTTKYK